MAKFIVSEGMARLIARNMLEESYQDKVDLVKDYLDKNFMRASFEKDGENVGIFVKLSNGLPTDKSMWKQDVLDVLDKQFSKLVTDKKERDGFLNQVLDDWYSKRISKFGSLSSYNF
jgi:hypothetical protein